MCVCLRRSWGTWEDWRGVTVRPQAMATPYDSEQTTYLYVPRQEPKLNGMLLLPSSAVLGTKIGLTDTGTQDTRPYRGPASGSAWLCGFASSS